MRNSAHCFAPFLRQRYYQIVTARHQCVSDGLISEVSAHLQSSWDWNASAALLFNPSQLSNLCGPGVDSKLGPFRKLSINNSGTFSMAYLPMILAILFTGATAGTAFAGFDEGVSAFKRKDHAVALEEFRAGAKKGHAGAQYYLGRMYLMADGVSANYKQSADFFRKAAAQGHANAQYYLGVLYYLGEGVPQDYSTAVKWYSEAAAQGDRVAQFSLGVMYASGEGGAADYVQALMWFDLAAAGGSEAAEKFGKIMTGKMTAAEISRAKQLARERNLIPRKPKPNR
jgi:hypothetical protein